MAFLTFLSSVSQVHSAIGASAEESICVTILSGTPRQDSSEPEFVHFIDKEAGSLNIYKLGPLACVDYQVKGVLTADFHSRSADLVSTVVFPRETERIVGVAYRNSLDTVNSRSAILGEIGFLGCVTADQFELCHSPRRGRFGAAQVPES